MKRAGAASGRLLRLRALMLSRSLDTALTARDGLLLGQCLTGAGMTDRDRSVIAAAAWLKETPERLRWVNC